MEALSSLDEQAGGGLLADGALGAVQPDGHLAGGGLGVGGSSSGFMTARGAADFLTRSTAILGGMFIVLSIVMAAIAGATR